MPEVDLGIVQGPKGDQGDPGPRGEQGVQGDPGASATINGLPAITITPGPNVELKQEGSALEIGAVVPGKNLLINWYFRNPVNRNGETEYTGYTYTIDKWYTEGTVVKIEDDGLQLENTSENETQFYCTIKSNQLFDGRTYTASILAKNLVGSGILVVRQLEGMFSYLFSSALSDGLVSASGPILTSGISAFGFAVRLQPHSSIKLIAAKFELGDQQTLARQNADGEWEIIDPPDYDLQYLICSQYSPITGA